MDFDTILEFKKECVVRDIENHPDHYDMYAKHGGYEHVFNVHYSGNYHNLIKPVEGWSDYVLEKDDEHHVTRFDRFPGRWTKFQKSVRVEHTVAVVVGASQVGMSASYHLKEKGINHIIIEKDSEVGSPGCRLVLLRVRGVFVESFLMYMFECRESSCISGFANYK